MIRTDKLYINGGCVGINSADGALHIAVEAKAEHKQKKKVDDHYIDADSAAVCLGCTKSDCTGDTDCYIMERNRRNGKAEDRLYSVFMDEYRKMTNAGLTITDVSRMLNINKSTLWRSMRRHHFGGTTAARIMAYLDRIGVKYE